MLRIETLLDGIDDGLIVLPDFQRDFDWDDRDVRALLVTVLSGWPAGSLLLMTGESTFFRTRPIESAPPGDPHPDFVVLDGQQRLTALYQAFRNAGVSVYAVRLDLLGEGTVDQLEESVVSYDRREWEEQFATSGGQYLNQLLPLTALRTAPDFFAWRDEVVAAAPPDSRAATDQRLTDSYKRWFAGIHSYELPTVVVPSRIAPSAIARIFERVNRTGMQLEAFDLVVARSYEPGWNLRDHYQTARETSPLIDDHFDYDGLPILQVIAMKETRSIRESDVLDLPGSTVRREWSDAVHNIDEALAFLNRACGVEHPEWMPYRAIPIVLAAVAAEGTLEDRRAELQQWFWSTSFGLAYDVASNTRAVADYLALTRQRDPMGRTTFVSRGVLLEATRRRQGALWRAFMCSLASNGARDLRLDAPLTRTSDADRDYQRSSPPVVHALVSGAPADSTAARFERRVLSNVLALPETARQLRRLGVRNTLGDAPDREPVLASQLLPSDTANLTSDPAAFIERRADLLAEFLVRFDVTVEPDAVGQVRHPTG